MAGKKTKVAEPPDGPPDATGLTPRQQRVLTVIKDSIERRGYPPSMREIGERAGLTSSSSVAHQLRVLEEKGYLKRDPHRPRALSVFDPDETAAVDETGVGDAMPAPNYVPLSAGSRLRPDPRRGAGGGPRRAAAPTLVGDGTLFLLEVAGDSMIDAAICNGDYVVVRQQPTAENGEIVAAMLDGELAGDLPAQGRQVWLLPHNEAYDLIDGTHATILGKVTAVLRRV